MNPLIKELMARRQKLEAVIRKAEADLKKLPEGKLWVSKKNNTPQYYVITQDDGVVTKRYIPKANQDIRNGLAQREYLGKMIKKAELELQDINFILSRERLFQAEEIHSQFHPSKKHIVIPMLMNDEEFALWWENNPFESYDKWPEELKYPTKRGEMVRTKSEAMIADCYYELGIPYRYECAVKLYKGEVRHPDFTLLDKSKRKVFYHEHLGLLDDSGYRRENMQKLDLYRQSGIFVGKNLILTHEVAGSPLNIRVFKQNMKELFEIS